MYPDLSRCHDWPVKKVIVPLPIRMEGNSKRTSGNSLNPLGAQNKDVGTASRTILTEVKLRLPRRLIALKLQQNRRSCRATKSEKKIASVNGSKELRVVIDYSYRSFGSTES